MKQNKVTNLINDDIDTDSSDDQSDKGNESAKKIHTGLKINQ